MIAGKMFKLDKIELDGQQMNLFDADVRFYFSEDNSLGITMPSCEGFGRYSVEGNNISISEYDFSGPYLACIPGKKNGKLLKYTTDA